MSEDEVIVSAKRLRQRFNVGTFKMKLGNRNSCFAMGKRTRLHSKQQTKEISNFAKKKLQRYNRRGSTVPTCGQMEGLTKEAAASPASATRASSTSSTSSATAKRP
jgi:hypothetical protein